MTKAVSDPWWFKCIPWSAQARRWDGEELAHLFVRIWRLEWESSREGWRLLIGQNVFVAVLNTRGHAKLFGRCCWIRAELHEHFKLGIFDVLRIGHVTLCSLMLGRRQLVLYKRIGPAWSIRPHLIKKGA